MPSLMVLLVGHSKRTVLPWWHSLTFSKDASGTFGMNEENSDSTGRNFLALPLTAGGYLQCSSWYLNDRFLPKLDNFDLFVARIERDEDTFLLAFSPTVKHKNVIFLQV